MSERKIGYKFVTPEFWSPCSWINFEFYAPIQYTVGSVVRDNNLDIGYKLELAKNARLACGPGLNIFEARDEAIHFLKTSLSTEKWYLLLEVSFEEKDVFCRPKFGKPKKTRVSRLKVERVLGRAFFGFEEDKNGNRGYRLRFMPYRAKKQK